jgi:deoxyribodipyrimidine photo-lyase
MVDAAMRQLLETGSVANRARMVAASFLVKDLHIDWRRGEQWFRTHLTDGDLASNAGSWQWVAGTGLDAAPYFRIFNPTLQEERFDPTGAYAARWAPDRPAPIVEHAIERDKTLAAYKAVAAEKS